jgi:hypothetical protein
MELGVHASSPRPRHIFGTMDFFHYLYILEMLHEVFFNKKNTKFTITLVNFPQNVGSNGHYIIHNSPQALLS